MEDPQARHPLRDRPAPTPDDNAAGKSKRIALKIPGSVDRPYVTYTLLVINVFLFVMRYINVESAISILEWGVADTQAIVNGGEYYRLFTAMFLHLNETHILFNGIALYYLGMNLERVFGHVRFLTIYMLGGLTGSIFMLFPGGSGLGASGAVFAIWGAELIFLYRHRQMFGTMARERIRSSLIFMGMNFAIGFLANTTDSGIRISNAAHLGGLIGGLILTWFVGPRFEIQRVQTTSADAPPIQVVQSNRFGECVRCLLYYSAGLLTLLLVAMLIH